MVVVSLRWNGEPLATRTGKAGETVVLGDAREALAPLPEAALGCATLIIADAEGGPHVRVPAGKVASITGGKASGVRLVAGPERVALAAGEEAQLVLGAFEVVVAASVPEAAPRRRRLAAGAWVHTAVVAAIHGALLVASSHTALASQMEEAEPDLALLRGYLAAAEERSSSPDAQTFDTRGKADGARANGRSGNGRDGGGEKHSGESGKAGASTSRAASRRFGATAVPEKGTAATAASEMEAARSFGMVGLLTAPQAGFAARTEGATPWGANDPFAAFGGLLGRVTGESGGAAALGLSGIGEGGGGRGEGIGLGLVGTIGHTDGLAGLGTGGEGASLSATGFGRGWGGWGSHRTKSPTIRWGGSWCGSSVSGRLPAESIRRIVRANFGRFRACYEAGLRANPQLSGRVSTSFVIGRDGGVMSVTEGGSDLPDAGVVSCVQRSFYGLSFPQPEGGIVSVVYPITFSSPDQL